jgi:ABC-type transport system substrate-binding protein
MQTEIEQKIFNNLKDTKVCVKFTDKDDIQKYYRMFFTRPGLLWCTKHHIPKLETFISAKQENVLLDEYGFYVNSGQVFVIDKNVAAIGDTTITLTLSHKQTPYLISAMFGGKIIVHKAKTDNQSDNQIPKIIYGCDDESSIELQYETQHRKDYRNVLHVVHPDE